MSLLISCCLLRRSFPSPATFNVSPRRSRNVAFEIGHFPLETYADEYRQMAEYIFFGTFDEN